MDTNEQDLYDAMVQSEHLGRVIQTVARQMRMREYQAVEFSLLATPQLVPSYVSRGMALVVMLTLDMIIRDNYAHLPHLHYLSRCVRARKVQVSDLALDDTFMVTFSAPHWTNDILLQYYGHYGTWPIGHTLAGPTIWEFLSKGDQPSADYPSPPSPPVKRQDPIPD